MIVAHQISFGELQKGGTHFLSERPVLLANEKKCRSLSNALFFFWLSAKKYRTYGTFSKKLQKVPNLQGKHQKVPYVRYISAGYRQKYRRMVLFGGFSKEITVCTVLFGTNKMAKISIVFENQAFPGTISPSIAFYNFRGQEKLPNVPKITGFLYLFFKVGPTFLELPMSELFH